LNFHKLITLIFVAFLLSACGGGSGTELSPTAPILIGGSPTSNATTTDISGKVTYDRVPHNLYSGLDYANTIEKPVRGAVIEAVDASGKILAETILDDAGQYKFTVDASTEVRVQVKAQLRSDTAAHWDFRVTDNTKNNQLYALQGSLVSSGSNSQQTRNLHAPHGWSGQTYDGDRAAAPFAILDTVYMATQNFAAIQPDIVFPPLELRWSPNNKTLVGQRSLGQIGTSSYVPDETGGGAIYILGEAGRDTDEFDPHVIIHEWGHYFEHQMSRTDSIGGLHSLNDRLDARVAFSEGWCNALSAIILDDPVYRDSSGVKQAAGFSFSLESHSAVNPGWFSEASVGAIIYDLYDDSEDAGDQVSEGLEPIYNVMLSDTYKQTPVFTTIFALADGLRQSRPDKTDEINGLLASHSIFGQGPNGNGESNSGAIRSALPVYKEVILNGASAQLCSVDDAGVYNKLGNREFIFLKLEEEQNVRLSLMKSSGDADRDPDFNIWKGTDLIHNASSSGSAEEVYEGRLKAGEYVIEAFDFFNINGVGPRRGDGCYSFTATG